MGALSKTKELCHERNVTIRTLESDLGFGNGYIGNKTKDDLPFDRVVAIADYFEVPIEFFTADDDFENSKMERTIKYGQRLKQLREANGYTQESLAEKLGTTRSRIANYEQGIREPDFEMQEAIADLFKVTIDYLFGRDENIQNNAYDDNTVRQALTYYKRISQLSPEKQAVLLNLIDTLQD